MLITLVAILAIVIFMAVFAPQVLSLVVAVTLRFVAFPFTFLAIIYFVAVSDARVVLTTMNKNL